MGMAHIEPPLLWKRENIEEVKMMWVQHHGPTSTSFDRLGSAPSLWVCKHCRMGESLCRCSWRSDNPYAVGGEPSDNHERKARPKHTWPGQGDDRATRDGRRHRTKRP